MLCDLQKNDLKIWRAKISFSLSFSGNGFDGFHKIGRRFFLSTCSIVTD